MAITEERMNSLLAYCHVTDPDDADLTTVTGMYEAAVGDLTEAGVSEPDAGTARRAQYDLLINAIVLDAYDHRGTQTETGAALTENPAFRRRLNQLKLTEVSILDTETT